MLLSYAFSFDEALKEAATTNPEERQAKMSALMRSSDARKARIQTWSIFFLFMLLQALQSRTLASSCGPYLKGVELGAVSVWQSCQRRKVALKLGT
jgi:hypothetical protein